MEPHHGETLQEQAVRAERVVREALTGFSPEERAVIDAFLDDVTDPEEPRA
ncbi:MULTISPECIES: hypothetical protein [unclassified Leifsonia]|uniref:hypothetical protein n=1 Tax=unclassified Leifsonia TaxID=2663824 RepID=UPI000A9EB042|nr:MULTISPECIES: hypothetical protein [unclassified Leifsonia]